MYNFISITAVSGALGLSLFIGVYTLFKSQSYKKNYFFLMQAMIAIYLFGYLLELTSTNVEEALTAVKVLYIGATLVASFAFFFISDYCNIRVHPFLIKIPMVLIAVAVTLIMWTSDYQHLIYTDFRFDASLAHHLDFTPGPLYSLLHVYPTICMILSIAVLVNQMKIWKNRYRNQLFILLACVAIPFIAEVINFVTVMLDANSVHIYLTPHSIAIMSLCIFIGVIHFNIFEIISFATATAMEHIQEGFVLVDEDDNFLSSNSAAVKIFPEMGKFRNGEPVSSIKGWPEKLRDKKKSSIDFSIFDGIYKYYTASISPVYSKSHAIIARIILFREITDSVNLMKELENAAYIDALTGIYNRKHFFELANVDVERAFRLDQAVYAAMLDLDYFKKINDTYGHLAGDMVLKSIAGIIRQTIRSYDLLCRYGGEEFVLLLTDLDAQNAYRLVERIRENIEYNIIEYEDKEITVTCCIGLARFLEIDSLDDAIKKADEALYVAKNSGRNQVQIFGLTSIE